MVRIEGGVPSGGHQTDWRNAQDHLRIFTIPREEPRTMFSGEFLALLHEHKHPRWPTVTVAFSELSNANRQKVGLEEHGSVYSADAYHVVEHCAVPCNELPYTTIRTKTYDDVAGKWSEEGTLLRGWRPTINILLRAAVLKPSAELTFLIGEDSFKKCPREYWQ